LGGSSPRTMMITRYGAGNVVYFPEKKEEVKRQSSCRPLD
jgi:hypothetical protein